MKKINRLMLLVIGCCCISNSMLFSQNDSVKNLKTIDVEGKTVKAIQLKKNRLYDEYELDTSPSIRGFKALNLYSDFLTDEIWKTENLACIDLSSKSENTHSGSNCLSVKWNKTNGICPWIGVGFGWNSWAGKDMSQITDTAAIEFYVKSNTTIMSNFPGAIGFEDYASKQAWIGFSSNFIEKKFITKNWTKITIPLALFPFEENGIDLSIIKHMLIQFESEGSIDIDDVKIVPYSGKFCQSFVATPKIKELKIDGDIQVYEWENNFSNFGAGNSFSVQYDEDNLYLAMMIKDSTPLVNNLEGGDIWKGDAIEIAFGSNPEAKKKRKYYLLSDYQFGIKCTKNPLVWNWKTNSEMKDAKVISKEVKGGYTLEFQIPLSSLSKRKLNPKAIHGFEIAVDYSGQNNSRSKQERWNNPDIEGFNVNPSLWGELILK